MYATVDAIVRPEVHAVLEEGPNNWSAYVPSIPGCISTGKTQEEVRRNIEEALSFHLEGLHEMALEEEAAEETKAHT